MVLIGGSVLILLLRHTCSWVVSGEQESGKNPWIPHQVRNDIKGNPGKRQLRHQSYSLIPSGMKRSTMVPLSFSLTTSITPFIFVIIFLAITRPSPVPFAFVV